jgi:hypothetical protein
MKPVDKSNRDAAQARQKRLGQEEITQADRAISQALMVWADDGGATGQSTPWQNN